MVEVRKLKCDLLANNPPICYDYATRGSADAFTLQSDDALSVVFYLNMSLDLSCPDPGSGKAVDLPVNCQCIAQCNICLSHIGHAFTLSGAHHLQGPFNLSDPVSFRRVDSHRLFRLYRFQCAQSGDDEPRP